MPDTRILQADTLRLAHTEPLHPVGAEPARMRPSQLPSRHLQLCSNEPMIPNSADWHLPEVLRRVPAAPAPRPVDCKLVLHSIGQDGKVPVFASEARIDARTSLHLRSPIWADPRIEGIAQTSLLLVGPVR